MHAADRGAYCFDEIKVFREKHGHVDCPNVLLANGVSKFIFVPDVGCNYVCHCILKCNSSR